VGVEFGSTATPSHHEKECEMRAIVKTGPHRGAEYVTDQPEPVPGPDEVLIEVAAVSICGTDREMFEWTPAAEAFGLRFPVVLGHEFAGRVSAIGSAVTRVKVGDRVACETHIPCGHCYLCRTGDAHNCLEMGLVAMHRDGAFAEKIVMPERVCFVLPDELSWETGALLEPAGVAWHAMQRSAYAAAASSVVVTGCGPVGLLVQEFARHLGATEILAVDPNDYRRSLAAERGATVFASSAELREYAATRYAERGGVDLAFEASGAPGTLQLLLEVVRREARVVTIGHPSAPVDIDIARYINKKGVILSGVFGRRIWDTWEELTAVLASGRLDLEWLISHRLPLGELEPIMELLASEANKIVLLPAMDAD
jgi:threonine 3-dehydrogenase